MLEHDPRLHSGDEVMDHLGRHHSSQFLIETLKLEGQPVVIEAELVQHRRVEVADMDRIFDDVVGEVVGFRTRARV